MSISVDQARMLLEELGPGTPEIEAIVQTGHQDWAVQLEGEQVVLLEWADQPGRLVLSATLGRANSGQALSIYETLLSYNLLWIETGGVRMALDGPQGEVMLIYDLFGDQITMMELRTVLLNFANVARVWGQYVMSEAAAPAAGFMSSDVMNLRA